MVELQKVGFEKKNKSGHCSKFWRGWVTGRIFHANWGKIGTTGQSGTWEFSSNSEAEEKLADKVSEKLGNSYRRITNGRLVVRPSQIVEYVPDDVELDNLS